MLLGGEITCSQVARLPFGEEPQRSLQCELGTVAEANTLLAQHHYLGPISNSSLTVLGWRDDLLCAAQVWKLPTARMLPADGSWMELARWCIGPLSQYNDGSRMMGWTRRWFRRHSPTVSTLVSYSDPAVHDGSLYRASGWDLAPTHHTERLRANGVGYPSGHGSWDGHTVQRPKERWVIHLH